MLSHDARLQGIALQYGALSALKTGRHNSRHAASISATIQPLIAHVLAATMKFISFNINGLRARPHQLEAIDEKHQPDVIGLQETKVHDDMFPLEEVAKLGYNVFYHGQKGHYGVALLTKETPVSVRRGFPDDDEEAQRRIIIAEIP